MEYLHCADRSLHTVHVNKVAHAIGFEEEDDEAAREVLKIAREGHTDGHTCGGDEGGKRSGVDAKGTDDGDDKQDGQDDVHQTAEGGLHALFDMAALEDGGHEAVEQFDEETTHDEDDNSSDDVLAR